MRKLLVVAVVSGLMSLAAVAWAGPDHSSPPDPLPEHPHVLVLGLEFDGEDIVGARKCIDLAANRALPLNAHHDHVHFGPAGDALFVNGSHGVAPTAPFPDVPWANCEELLAFFLGG